MSLYRDEAVVLRTHKLGEADRIVSLHTRSHGKVRGVAKGVRRTRSKFGSRLEPLTHVAIQLYRGRGDLDTITQVETQSRFAGLRADPVRFARAESMLEAVEHLALEREPDPDLYVLLLRALATLESSDSALVVPAFFLKVLAQQGLQPEVGACIVCGAPEPIESFDLRDGGVLCSGCRRGRPLSAEALGLLRRILGGGLAGVLADGPSPADREVDRLATALLEQHLERRLRSLAVLEETLG